MNHHYHHQKHQLGFTLIELMVVLVMLSIFAGFVSLSVGSADVRKNKAFYDNFVDTLNYVRLVSAERMQPLGIGIDATQNPNSTNEVQLQAFTLSNAYASYQQDMLQSGDLTKNSMELSALETDNASKTPKWVVDAHITLPTIPNDVEVVFIDNQIQPTQMQPWFDKGVAPSIMWFGTGQATPAMIEIRYQGRLVDDVITLQPDGAVQIGSSQPANVPRGAQ